MASDVQCRLARVRHRAARDNSEAQTLRPLATTEVEASIYVFLILCQRLSPP